MTRKLNRNVRYSDEFPYTISLFEFIIQFNFLYFTDRQRNEEKKRMAQEENMRLEAEKERKRKALTLSKVS